MKRGSVLVWVGHNNEAELVIHAIAHAQANGPVEPLKPGALSVRVLMPGDEK